MEVTGIAAEEHGRISMNADGSVTVYVGSSAQGQGHQTTFAMIIADQLGVPLDQVHVRHTDTGALGQGVGTFGSRSMQLGGSALAFVLRREEQKLVAPARRIARERFGDG